MENAGDENCVEPLVQPQWLSHKITSGDIKDLRIFDCTFTDKGIGLENFKSSHIAGAQFLSILDLRDEVKNLIPLNPPSTDVIQERLQSLGVNNDSHVILYENVTEHGYTGPRVWFLLKAFGHKKVSLLDGGLKKWTSLGLPVTTDIGETQRGNFQASLNKNNFLKFEDVQKCLQNSAQVLDARPMENFNGDEKEPSFLLKLILHAFGIEPSNITIATGHMKSAKAIPYPNLFNDDDEVTFKTAPELRQVFKDAGIDLEKPLITTCYVGLCACQLALAAAVCGKHDVQVYTGAWLEYGQRTATPE